MLLPRPVRDMHLGRTPAPETNGEDRDRIFAVAASAFLMSVAQSSTFHIFWGVARVCRPRRYLDGARRAARGLGDRRARTASDLGDGVARRELRVPLPHLRRLLRDQVRGRVDAPYAGATDRAEAGARRDREEGDDDAQMHEPVADGRVDQSIKEDAKSRRGRLALLWVRGGASHAGSKRRRQHGERVGWPRPHSPDHPVQFANCAARAHVQEVQHRAAQYCNCPISCGDT